MNWTVSEQKVRTYLLNTAHPVGVPKARVFLSRGFSVAAWRVLTAALRQHPIDNPAESSQQTGYGLRLTVRCRLTTPDGSNPCIRTVWMVEPGLPARLVTAYPQAP